VIAQRWHFVPFNATVYRTIVAMISQLIERLHHIVMDQLRRPNILDRTFSFCTLWKLSLLLAENPLLLHIVEAQFAFGRESAPLHIAEAQFAFGRESAHIGT